MLRTHKLYISTKNLDGFRIEHDHKFIPFNYRNFCTIQPISQNVSIALIQVIFVRSWNYHH